MTDRLAAPEHDLAPAYELMPSKNAILRPLSCLARPLTTAVCSSAPWTFLEVKKYFKFVRLEIRNLDTVLLLLYCQSADHDCVLSTTPDALAPSAFHGHGCGRAAYPSGR